MAVAPRRGAWARRAGAAVLAFCLLPAPRLAAAAGSQTMTAPVAQPSLLASTLERGGPAWSSLTPAQRGALAPLQRDWPQLTGPQKDKWLEVAARFGTMPPAERARVQERMTEWSRLSPVERSKARLNFQEARQLSPEDRSSRWQAYQALPAQQKQALIEQARPAGRPGAASTTPAGAASAPASGVKRNTVTAERAPAPRAVAPTVVQARPGVSTTLMSRPAEPPVHHQAGLPKIAATAGFVDPDTLLPLRGPQGAARGDRPHEPQPDGSTP